MNESEQNNATQEQDNVSRQESSVTPEQILAEISMLRDLFQRRLIEDKTKAAAIEQLSQANDRLVQTLKDVHFSSLMKEILMVCDRFDSSEDYSPLVQSVRDELLEIAERRGITAIPSERIFNPAIHNAVQAVAPTEEHPASTIVKVVRNGYYLNDKVFRPADVVVASDRLG